MPPLISVLIPSYNYASYVGRALESVLAQTQTDLEVVVTDDRSTDDAPAIVARYAERDARVRFSTNERTLGVAGNFNRALSQARGAFVHWLPADDWLLPDHLERLTRIASGNPNVDVVYARIFFADEQGRIHSVKVQENMLPCDGVDVRDELPQILGGLPPLAISATLWRRSAFAELGPLDETLPILFDWEIAARFAAAGKRFAFSSDPSACVRLHPGSASGLAFNESGQTLAQGLRVLEKYLAHPSAARLAGRERRLLARLEHLYVVDGERLTASGSEPAFAERYADACARLRAAADVYEPARVREQSISVILPVLGPYESTRAAVDSVAAQSFPNWQLVVIDQGVFPIRDVLRAHPAWDRIAYLRLPRVRPPGAIRNIGADAGRGTYLAFLDDDNRFAPEHLETLVSAIEASGAEFAVADARLIVEAPDDQFCTFSTLRAVDGIFRGPGDAGELGLVANAIPLNAILHHRRFFEEIGRFNDQVPLLEDFDYLMRLQSIARAAFTGATTLEVRVRLGLRLQALGHYAASYLATLDALYASRRVRGELQTLREAHREAVAATMAGLPELAASADGVVEAIGVLAGRRLFPARTVVAP